MKKFIFGVMLLVSMLGIVGCADPSNSDDPTVGNAVYRIKNGKNSEMTISYKNKSDVYVNEETIPANGNGIYEIPASNVKIGTEKIGNGVELIDSPVIYLQITVGNTKKEGYIGALLEKVVKINGVSTFGPGWFNDVTWEESIEN